MDLLKTLIVTGFGFLLTGVVGNWISHSWQKRNWRYQQEYGRKKELLTKQIEIVESISDLIGQRSFRMFRARAALVAREKSKIEESWKKYDESVFIWNDNVNGYITKLRQFFGKELQYSLDTYISSRFQEIGALLERAKRKFDAGKTDEMYFNTLERVAVELQDFSGHANAFIGGLWKHVDGLRSEIDGFPPISQQNARKLPYRYLIKNIFIARKKA